MCKLNPREVLSYTLRDTQLVDGNVRAALIPSALCHSTATSANSSNPDGHSVAGIPAAMSIPYACDILRLLI